MAFILKDRVRETSVTTGTGALTLVGAVAGYQAFSNVCSVGDTFWYAIVFSATAWETGIGTYSGVNTLTRTTILESSNANAAVSFGAGTKDVFIELPASRAATLFDAYAGNSQGGFSTGDIKWTWKTTADTAWIMVNDGTIGNGASGGTTRANADTVALYTLIYNNFANAQAAVSGGRGANAAADYAANKTIALPKALGRAIAVSGSGSGLTARTVGITVGEENHTMLLAEIAPHTHPVPTSIGGGGTDGANTGGAAGATITTNSTGSATPFNVMQPTSFWNVMVKL